MKQSFFVLKKGPAYTRVLLLLFGFFVAALGVRAQNPFGAGNLVVVNVSSTNTASLQEYTTAGAAVQTISLPSTGTAALTMSYTATSEGALSRSQNGQYLAFAGYRTGTNSSATDRVIARVANDGIVNTSSVIPNTEGYTSNNIRGAVFSDDGSRYWASGTGTGGGTRSNIYGSVTGSVQVSASVANTRTVQIFNNQLYISAASGAFQAVSAVGTGLPATLGNTTTILPGFPTTSLSSYAFAINAANNIIYIADDRSIATGGGIQKWTNNGTTWSFAYSLGTGTGSTVGARGLAVDFSGTQPVIYAVTAEATLDRIISITDNGVASTATTLATSAANNIFRGLAFAPTSNCALSLAATGNNPACSGQSATISFSATGATGIASFTVNGVAATSPYTASTSGTYTVSVAAGGCTDTKMVTIAIPSAMTVVATAPALTCPGSTTFVTVNTTGGKAPYTVTGSPLTVGAGTYNYTVTDSLGCITTASITVAPGSDAILPSITAPAALTISTDAACTAAGINLGTPVTADNCAVASVTNNAPAAFPLGATTVTWTVTDSSGNSATATQVVTVQDTLKPAIAFQSSNILAGITGPSTTQTPYLTALKKGVQFKSFLSVNDAVGGYKMAGIPDGLGAFDNGNGTFTLLVNHEIGNTLGITRAHGSKGSFVSKWIVNKADLSVVRGSDLMQNVNLYDTTTKTYTTYNAGNPSTKAVFGRFCSADLPALSAFYNTASGLGTTERIFMNGEETNDESRQMAHIVTGANAGTSWELPAFGKAAWENSVANPATGNKTVVAEFNDGTDGQVYVYVGTKTNTGTEIEKAGLTNGKPYGVKVTGFPAERTSSTVINLPPAPGTHFDLVDLGDVKNITGVSFNTISNAAAVTKFSRPEDGAWDPSHPADLYFNTTDQLDQVNEGIGTQVGRSRIWRLRFTDINQPLLGGTVEAVIDGTEGALMLDNMTIDNHGHILAQEDVGNADHNGKIWQYNIATDSFFIIASHDTARFGDVKAGVIKPATVPFNKDEESSGLLDVSDILGQGMFLTTVQAHYAPALNTAEVVEGGQLLALYNPYSLGTSTAMDTVRSSAGCSGPILLGTPATADNCSVASVTSNAPASFPLGTTTVTYTVTDASGNTATATQVVIVTDSVKPTITAPAALTIGTNAACTAAGINLGTPVTADNCAVASVTNNAPSVFALGATTVTWTVTDSSGNSATATQVVTVQDTLKPAIALQSSIIPAGLTGPSTTQSPYLTSLKPGVQFKSFLSVNDAVGGYKMAGIPDGLGAFDNGNGTFTLLVNHEIGNTLGIARAHGSKGSFVSKWIVNKADLSVVSGSDLMQNVNLYDTATKTYTTYNAGNPSTKAVFGRFCSADLPALSAFYNTASGLGTTERIFMNGEETNDESRQMAHIVTGANAGTSWELPAFGKAAWENSVANPATGNKTVVAEFNDGTDGQVYVYVGTKTNTGTEIEKAGLTNGKPYGVKVTGFPAERTSSTVINLPPAPGTHFDLVDLGDVKNITGVSFNTLSNAAAVTKFSRPEDGAWDPSHPADLYFNTTDQLDQVADGIGTQIGRSRIWRLRFTDINQPLLGGTVEAVIDGTEGALMLDNMTIDNRGHILAQEDVGNADHNGKIWQYNIATDSFFRIASHDTARFGNVTAGVIKPATAPFNRDEESSGIIDVSDILGQGMFLTTVQAHYAPALNTTEVVEGGQLLALYNPYSLGTSTAPDTVKVSVPFGTTSTPVSLGTPATADNCSVVSVTNNAPSGFPAGTTNVTWTATDASGNSATTNQVVVVTVTGNVPPVVSITNPANPAVFDAGSAITVQVNATDADGSVTKTELFVNGALFMTDSIAPYTFGGSNVEPGVYNVYVKATDNTGAFTVSDTVVITVNGCSGSGAITGEGYTNITGSQVADLTANPAYPNSPSITAALTTFEYSNVADNYGGRVRGYFCAPVSGNYIFNISGDDQAGLWLSTDANPANKVLIAYTELPTAFRQWNKYATQKSAVIPMVKGARYYIETLQKEAVGSDHLSVAVTFPGGLFEGPIKGSRLSPIGSSARTVSGAQAFAAAMESKTIVGFNSLKVSATPNPSTNYFTLRTSSSDAKTLDVKVMDAQGRIVETKLNMTANGIIRIGDKLPAGIYFVEVLQGTQKERLKLVKQ
ncbi:HYR domain-containing protein [Ferruginibacter paludis]|uniref:HYR domain-containing protein n=1 Tax=Ferruginibacter paludis TaxID=1310417 RepID=UPI0025B375A6|nr:HYR domain-containing protein [Ferruginibacter paludis]MDN3656743.1 HYR domain-containing protein [Ferruginibacter paludis]